MTPMDDYLFALVHDNLTDVLYRPVATNVARSVDPSAIAYLKSLPMKYLLFLKSRRQRSLKRNRRNQQSAVPRMKLLIL